MRRMNISDVDASLIIDTFPTLQDMINASYDKLVEVCPIEIDSAERVEGFFGAKVKK